MPVFWAWNRSLSQCHLCSQIRLQFCCDGPLTVCVSELVLHTYLLLEGMKKKKTSIWALTSLDHIPQEMWVSTAYIYVLYIQKSPFTLVCWPLRLKEIDAGPPTPTLPSSTINRLRPRAQIIISLSLHIVCCGAIRPSELRQCGYTFLQQMACILCLNTAKKTLK